MRDTTVKLIFIKRKKLNRTEIKQNRDSDAPKVQSLPQDYREWFLRSGIFPESHLGVSRIGIYTDFT